MTLLTLNIVAMLRPSLLPGGSLRWARRNVTRNGLVFPSSRCWASLHRYRRQRVCGPKSLRRRAVDQPPVQGYADDVHSSCGVGLSGGLTALAVTATACGLDTSSTRLRHTHTHPPFQGTTPPRFATHCIRYLDDIQAAADAA